MPFRTTGVCLFPSPAQVIYVYVADKFIGGSPYDDLVKCWEYVRDNFDFVDMDRAVAAGASYGAFVMNWIQGNPLGRKFKALVSHDGTFVGDAKINTDELWFLQHEVSFLQPHPIHPTALALSFQEVRSANQSE